MDTLPSPTDLTYFLEIAVAKNMTRASERLGVSQPSLTLAMHRLEDVVGAKLLIRGSQGVSLTPAGKQLQTRARELLQSWSLLRSEALKSQLEVQGLFTLGCHPSVARYALPLFLPKLLAEFPKLELRLLHDLSRRVTDSVIRMEADFGIAVNPTRHPDLVVHLLGEDEVTLWGASDAEQDTLIYEPDLLQSQEILAALKRSKSKYRRLLPTSSLEVVAKLAAAGAGVGILPGRVAALEGKALRRLPKAPVVRDEIYWLYRVENRSVRAVQALTERVAAAF